MDELEEVFKREHPKMLYVIPTFQNPTGRTLSLPRRKRVAELAEKYGVVVAEDDPYRDLRYAGEALPSIKSFDRAGMVALLGSFSKVISPGLRVGFMAADKLKPRFGKTRDQGPVESLVLIPHKFMNPFTQGIELHLWHPFGERKHQFLVEPVLDDLDFLFGSGYFLFVGL